MDFAESVGLVRDILLIVLLALTTVALLILLWKVSGLLNSVRRTARNVEELVETVSSRIVAPAAAGSGVAFGVGKLASFFLGFSRKRNDRGGKNNGKR